MNKGSTEEAVLPTPPPYRFAFGGFGNLSLNYNHKIRNEKFQK